MGQLIYWASIFFLTLFVFYLTAGHEGPLYLWLALGVLALFGAWAIRPVWCAGIVLLVALIAFYLRILAGF